MTDRGIDDLLQRLVAQFASPYDFLRELVQNAMDAGSDLVDVTLRTHAGAEGEVVFELEVADAGDGMDEAILDGELTRLFASSKAGDRTMAGGFGIGFVSVFAWEPEAVVLQTGRRGEAWELVFAQDRSFEKHPVDDLIEGTTLRLFRAGAAAEREAIAEAIRDSLWRWCRFCPIDVTFEDEDGDAGPELIADAPLPEDAVVELEHVDGETTFRLGFAPVSHVVLLRHGLVLAEGAPAEHLPHLAPSLGRAADHLRLWIDSPRLRTSIARDSVVDDEGRAGLEREVATLLQRLRAQLLARIEAAAAADTWDAAAHEDFAFAHAHLLCEHDALGPELAGRPMLRSIGGTAVSPATLASRARAGIVAVVAPVAAPEPDEAALWAAAMTSGVPVVVARWPDDRTWLAPLLRQVGLAAVPLRSAISRVEPRSDGAALAGLVHAALGKLPLGLAGVQVGRLRDAADPPVCGFGFAGSAALHHPKIPEAMLAGSTVWLDPRNGVVAEAEALYPTNPSIAALALAEAVALQLGSDAARLEALAEAWEAMQ